MRNAEEFSGQRSGLARLRPAYRRPRAGAGGRPGSGRIRYAHGGALPPGEPLCPASQGPAGSRHTQGPTQLPPAAKPRPAKPHPV